jgi:hypothetical protein
VITTVEMEWLRGVRRGKLSGLTELTVLTGPNSCGKSTVLDALLLGASPVPEDALGRVVKRRPEVWNGAAYLVRRGAPERRAYIALTDSQADRRECWIEFDDRIRADLAEQLHMNRFTPPLTVLRWARDQDIAELVGRTGFGGDNRYWRLAQDATRRPSFGWTRLIDPGLPAPLVKIYSDAVRAGAKKGILALLRSLIPDFEDLEILTESDGTSSLNVIHATHAVPTGLSGDGIQAFLRTAL